MASDRRERGLFRPRLVGRLPTPDRGQLSRPNPGETDAVSETMTEVRESQGAAAPGAPRAVPPPLRCRPIVEADLENVVALLVRGFRERTAAYWRDGLDRMANLAIPEGCPRFGYVMAAGDRLVGVVLTIYSPSRDPDGTDAWCNISSWYVEPPYRAYATLLDKMVLRRPRTTVLNISAAPHTVPGHEARGFRRIGAGQILAAPTLAPATPGARIRGIGPGDAMAELAPEEARILRDHAAFGCVALVGSDGLGHEPFVFVRHPVQALAWRLGFSPVHYGQLIYCRSTGALPRFARQIGWHLLARHALPAVVVDADGPLPGFGGWFHAGWGLRLKRGADTVRPGDLAYTEMVIFGA